jgi:hypothetical protein
MAEGIPPRGGQVGVEQVCKGGEFGGEGEHRSNAYARRSGVFTTQYLLNVPSGDRAEHFTRLTTKATPH